MGYPRYGAVMRLRSRDLPTIKVGLRGSYYNSRCVKFRGNYYALSAGTSDSVEYWEDLYVDYPTLYVLTHNSYMGYMGLERIGGHPYEPTVHPLNPDYDPDVPTIYQVDWDMFLSDYALEEAKDYGLPLGELRSDNAIRYLSQWDM